MEEDFSSVVDARLPEIEQVAKSGKTSEAVDQLIALEKKTRVACDAISTGRVLVAIIKTLFEAGDLKGLNEQIIFLSKRRGQLKSAVTKMVQESATYVDKLTDKESKLALIETLRTVTAGKIYVEIERARLTRILATMKEEEGNIAEAAEILQELQVETFGSMDKKEKAEFILEQMRLCLAKKDYIRTQIVSKKISPKFFENVQHQDLKVRFYQIMVEVEKHDKNYLVICKNYRHIFDTPNIQADQEKWSAALKNLILYLILAPFDNEQSDMLHRTKQEKKLKQLPVYESLLKLFTTTELINLNDFEQTYSQELKTTSVFDNSEDGLSRWYDLKRRVIEHNIRVIAKYYTRISTDRLSELLNLTYDDAEKVLSDLVTGKTIFARIDRPAGIISFVPKQDPAERLNAWSRNIETLMNLVEKTTHLIVKEEMVHNAIVDA